MFCKHCGSKLEDNTKFCSNCGQPVKVPEQPIPAPAPAAMPVWEDKPQKVKGKINWKVFIIMMVIGALILGIGGFVIVNLLNGDGPFGDLLGGTSSSRRDDEDDDDDDDDRDKDDEDEDEDRDEDRDERDEGWDETRATEAPTQAPEAAVSDSYIYYDMGSFNFYIFDYMDLEEIDDDSDYIYLENENMDVTGVKWDKDDYEDLGIYGSMDMLHYMADSAEEAGLDVRYDDNIGQTYLVAYGDGYVYVISFYETDSYFYGIQVCLYDEAVDEYMYEAMEIVTSGYFD